MKTVTNSLNYFSDKTLIYIMHNKKYIIVISILFMIPFLSAWFLVVSFSSTIPIMDDFSLILRTINVLSSEDSINDKLNYLWQNHNEHRPLIPRFLVFLDAYIEGQINLVTLTITGFTAWCLFIILLIKDQINETNSYYKVALLMCISWILLNPIHWQNFYWATSSIQNLVCLFFVLLHFIFLNNKRFYLAIFVGMCSVLSSGAGVFIIPIGIGYFLFKRDLKALAIYSIIFLLFLVLYFYDHAHFKSHSSFAYVIQHPVEVLTYFFTFLGNALPKPALAIYLGIFIFITYIYLLIFIKFYKTNTLIFMLFSFVIICAVAAAFNRSSFGVEQALVSRYKIYSLISIACIYISLLHQKGLLYKYITVILSFVAFFAFILAYKDALFLMEKGKDKALDGMFLYHNFDNPNYLAHPNKNYARKILIESNAKGLYKIDSLDFNGREISKIINLDTLKVIKDANIRFSFTIEDSENLLLITGWAFVEKMDAKDTEIHLVLSSPKNDYKLSVNQRKRPDVTNYFENTKLYLHNSGIEAFIARNNLANGHYKIGVFIENNGNLFYKLTNKTIDIY